MVTSPPPHPVEGFCDASRNHQASPALGTAKSALLWSVTAGASACCRRPRRQQGLEAAAAALAPRALNVTCAAAAPDRVMLTLLQLAGQGWSMGCKTLLHCEHTVPTWPFERSARDRATLRGRNLDRKDVGGMKNIVTGDHSLT